MRKTNLPKHVQIQVREAERLHSRLKCEIEYTVWPYFIGAIVGVVSVVVYLAVK